MIDPQTYIAAFAAVVALLAAGFAWRSSNHAKRNADKALGDIEPFIEVFQVEGTLYGNIPQVAVQITNHNRHSLHLSKLSFETNDGFIAYRVSDEDEQLALAGIVDVIMDEDEQEDATHYSYEPPLRLPGNRLLAGHPPAYEFVFQVTERGGSGDEWRTVVGVNIEFTLGDDHEVRRVNFQREVRRNEASEWNARFRSMPTTPKA